MSAPPPLKLTAEELRELQNPREECSFSKYYPDLAEEDLLTATFVDQDVHSQIAANTPALDLHKTKQGHVDAERLKNLKRPSFVHVKTQNLQSNGTHLSEDTDKYIQLGFFNARAPKLDLTNVPYLRPDLKVDAIARGKVLFTSSDFQVAYDMDETDALFLEHLNTTYPACKVSMDLFEIIITFFELQIYMLSRILPPTIKDRTTIDIQQYQRAILYGSDDGTGCSSESDQECAVCGDQSSDSTNSIVFCDGCDIAVHQECYGVSFIPEGPWLCRKCLILRSGKARCLFCPSTTGAFKQTDAGEWAHVLCTIWISELYFANPIYMEPIEGVGDIPKSRWRLTCYICKKKMGACVQCAKPSCFQAFHATCGKRAGLYMKMRRGLGGALKNQNTLVAYCDKHSSHEWNRSHDMKTGIQKTKLYFHDVDNGIIKDSDSDLVPVTTSEYQDLVDTRSTRFQWRLTPSVFVIPEIILDRLESFLASHGFDPIAREELNLLAKYYTIKAENAGQQLIKKPDMLNLATLAESELHKRDIILSKFDTETASLLKIGNDVFEREKVNTKEAETQLDASFKSFQPRQYILFELVSPFLEILDPHQHYPKFAIKPTLHDIMRNVRLGQYSDVESLIHDIDRFEKWVQKCGGERFAQVKAYFAIWNKGKTKRIKKANDALQNIHKWKQTQDTDIGENLEIKTEKNQPRSPKKPKSVTSGGERKPQTEVTPQRQLRRRVARVPAQQGRVRVLRSGKAH